MTSSGAAAPDPGLGSDRDTASVEVCIVSYDSDEVLAATLEKLVAAAPNVRIAVREHGDDDAFAALAALSDGIDAPTRISHDPTNPGFGAGCNALAATSDAEHLLFLNPDAEVHDWPWSPDRPPPTGRIIGPTMIGDGATERHAGRRYRIRDEIARSWLRRPGPLPDGTGFVSGAALLIDRRSFEAIGGFDDGFFMFYEDIDLCLRANAAGISTHIDPDWLVLHAGGHSTGSRFTAALQWSYESACRFHAKQGSNINGYRAYVIVDSLARALVRTLLGRRSLGRAHLRMARRAGTDLVKRSTRA